MKRSQATTFQVQRLKSSKQLSLKSIGLHSNLSPTSSMFDHRIENCQQFAHASDERKLWSLPCIAQPLVESSNDSITFAANQSCHVERCTYGGPTAPRSCDALSVYRCHG